MRPVAVSVSAGAAKGWIWYKKAARVTVGWISHSRAAVALSIPHGRQFLLMPLCTNLISRLIKKQSGRNAGAASANSCRG